MTAWACALRTGLAASRPVPRALAGLAGLAVLAAWMWPTAGIAPEPPATPAEPVRPADGGGALRRPPFDPDRRAWTARGALADLTPATPVRPVLRVRGILVADGGGRALIEEEGAGPAVWLVPGEARAGWTLASVAAERVTVSQDGRTYDLAFLGEPAVLQPPRRRRPPDQAPPEASVRAPPEASIQAPPEASVQPEPPVPAPPALRLTEAARPGVRTIPIPQARP